MRITERAGIAHIPADATGTVPTQDLRQPRRDIGHRHVPRDRLESVRSPGATVSSRGPGRSAPR